MTTAMVSEPTPVYGAKKKARDPLPLKALLRCIPEQGEWTLEDFDYFADRMPDNPPLEFSHGRVVRKAMPLFIHAVIVAYLRWELEVFVRKHKLGRVFSEGAEFRYEDVMVRLPDVLFVSNENYPKHTERGLLAIDLAMEVLSASSRKEDLVQKRKDYALGGISEYWLIDRKRKQITVLKLEAGKYINHGVFNLGEMATSAVLPGFKVNVATVLAGGDDHPKGIAP